MRTDRQKDAQMDRLLRTALEGAAGGTAEGCPAPDELGAYLERTLSNEEVRSLERHVAECDRCQQVLVTLAEMPADSGEPAPAAGWWSTRSWRRWLVPAAAAAGALVLYVALKPQFGAESTTRTQLEPSATIAQQLPSTPSPAIGAPTSVAAPLREGAPSPAASPFSPAGRDGRARAALPSTPAPQPAVPAPAARAERSMEFTRTAARADRDPAKEERTAKQAPTAASEGRGLGGAITADAANKPAAQPTKLAAEAPPAAPTGAPPMTEYLTIVGAKRAADTRQASAAAIVAPIVVPAGTGEATRWRLDANGGISRSTDAGGSWQVQRQPGGSALLAGAASSANVCWAVGVAGAVLLTTDGTRWQPRPFPERVDLVAVTADDPNGLRATVRTRDGRRFSTTDGGATWVLR